MTKLFYGNKNRIIEHIKSENPDCEIINVEDHEKQANNFSIFLDTNKIFLHNNPNIENLKLIDEQIKLNRGIHFLYYEDESFDGRNSLIQSLKKSENIFNFSDPVFGDKTTLRRFIQNYTKKILLNLNNECLEYLIEFCPVVRTKTKTKKDIIYYDIDMLFRELDKIACFKNQISIEDLQDFNDVNDSELFSYFDLILNGKTYECLEQLEKVRSAYGDQSFLMIFIHQLIFLIEMQGLKENKFLSIDKVIEKLDLKDLINKYYDHNWNLSNADIKGQNPIRVKIEFSKKYVHTKYLSKILNIVVDTLKNLRNYGSPDNAMFLMITNISKVLKCSI